MQVKTVDGDLSPYEPIGCGDFEYIELACMDQYEIDVVTCDGIVQGTAIDIELKDSAEFFILRAVDGTRRSVRVDRIEKLIVRSEERRFDEHVFASRMER